MSYKIFSIAPFDKQLKRLSKKYPSLKKEYIELLHSLEKNPKQGTSLGKNCYKFRIAISSKGRGKSGGARVITYFQLTPAALFLLAIYDKAEQDNIADEELKALVKYISV